MSAPLRRYALTVRGTNGAAMVTIDVLARDAGLHPDLVRRLISLGALQPSGGTAAAPLYARDAAARLARIGRLRRDLGLNYAGALLACDLLDRIETLEALLTEPRPPR